MKIIIRDSKKKPLFTFDVGKGTAEISPDVEMDDVARAFVRGVAVMLLANKSRSDAKVRDVIMGFGGDESCGNLIFITGTGAEGWNGGDIRIEVPEDGSYLEIAGDGA